MTTATAKLHILDVVRVFNDPHLPVRTTEQVQALHTFISRFMHELQAAHSGEVAGSKRTPAMKT